jgi:hypothetical protein
MSKKTRTAPTDDGLTRVRFLRDTTLNMAAGIVVIAAGTEQELDAASLERWLRRGAVEIVVASAPAETE